MKVRQWLHSISRMKWTVEADYSVDSEHGKDTIESEGHETSEEDNDSISALKQTLEEIIQ